MRNSRKYLVCLVLALLGTGTARADIILNAVESGGNVVISGGGTADLTNLLFLGTTDAIDFVIPSAATIWPDAAIDMYASITGPAGFGSGGLFLADNSSGDPIGLLGAVGILFVPQGYVSNTPIDTTMTFNGQTLASMGLTPGTYVWTWGTGANADSLTLNITAIPEPSSYALCGAAMLGLLYWRRRKKV